MIRATILQLLFAIILVGLFSCTKEDKYSDKAVTLGFSTDTLMFDTVFTTIGSSTQYVIIRNPEDKAVKLSRIYLAGGANSNFRINVDGSSGSSHTDVEIGANDSIFIFVQVTVDPNNSNNPMIITDSIIFENKGKKQDVDLVAFGQDAYFIIPDHNSSGLPPYHIVARENTDTLWTNIKPIVIYGYAVVDSQAKLTIQEGTKIYFHSNSGLWIYKGGCLKVNGTKDNPVVFQGDRLEDYYKNIPGQWDRIWLNEGSIDNEINYAIIKNGFIGLQTEVLETVMGNKLILKNTKIQNMSGAGILSRFYKIDAENCIVSNCQQYLTALTMGGSYSFKHCTFANYWSFSIRNSASIYLNNYYMNPDYSIVPFDLVQADFINCILYGNQDDEITIDKNLKGGSMNYSFDHVLAKTKLNTNNVNWLSPIVNQNPNFKNTSEEDYHLNSNSAAIAKGKSGIVAVDFDGVVRNTTTPDLGAFEFVQTP